MTLNRIVWRNRSRKPNAPEESSPKGAFALAKLKVPALSKKFRRRTVLVVAVTCMIFASGGCTGGGSANSSSIPPFPLYWSVAVGDLNNDGKPDIVTSYSIIAGPAPDQGFVAVYLQDSAHPGTFLPPVTYSVGNDHDPVFIAIGDLNREGSLDIVTANTIISFNGSGSSDVSILLQDSTRPGQFLSATNHATGKPPVSVAIGDLNGDGKPDLAVADISGISLLFQDPSKGGSFLPAMTLSLGPAASSAAIDDVNGDQKPDVVATTSAAVFVLLQNPTMPGTFFTPTRYGAGSQPIGVAIADLNGDGKSDLAVANYGSPTDGSTASVSVLLQNLAAPGTFLSATNYKTDIRSQIVAIADLNGDGRADLAVANTGGLAGGCPPDCGIAGASVSVLLQDPALPGIFQATTKYAGTDQVLSVAVADMNGDNRADLVIAQGGGLVIRFQDPSNPGMFLPQTVVTK